MISNHYNNSYNNNSNNTSNNSSSSTTTTNNNNDISIIASNRRLQDFVAMTAIARLRETEVPRFDKLYIIYIYIYMSM